MRKFNLATRKYVAAEYEELRIPTSGHWVQEEAAAEVNTALKVFINQT